MGRRRAEYWRRLALGLGLLAIAALPALSGPVDDSAQLLLQDGFETGSSAVGGGFFYKDSIEQRAGRLSFRHVGSGYVEIFADGLRITTAKGRIGHDGPGVDKNQYFKFDPYRAPDALPWSVSYDNFRRDPRCADVMRGGQCPLD